MKRAGFTMIELIFVIVILGILAAVALPRFIGVSEQANAANCQALVGTLNRTIGPSMWSSSLMSGDGGLLLTTHGNAAGIRTEINRQIEIPPECVATTSVGNGASATTAYATNHTVTIGAKVYDVNFTDGTATSAPVWDWAEQ